MCSRLLRCLGVGDSRYIVQRAQLASGVYCERCMAGINQAVRCLNTGAVATQRKRTTAAALAGDSTEAEQRSRSAAAWLQRTRELQLLWWAAPLPCCFAPATLLALCIVMLPCPSDLKWMSVPCRDATAKFCNARTVLAADAQPHGADVRAAQWAGVRAGFLPGAQPQFRRLLWGPWRTAHGGCNGCGCGERPHIINVSCIALEWQGLIERGAFDPVIGSSEAERSC